MAHWDHHFCHIFTISSYLFIIDAVAYGSALHMSSADGRFWVTLCQYGSGNLLFGCHGAHGCCCLSLLMSPSSHRLFFCSALLTFVLFHPVVSGYGDLHDVYELMRAQC